MLAFIANLCSMLHFLTNCWISYVIVLFVLWPEGNSFSPTQILSLVTLFPPQVNVSFTRVPSICNGTFFRLFRVIFNSLIFMSNSQYFAKMVYLPSVSHFFLLSFALPITMLKFKISIIFHLHNHSSLFSDFLILHSVAFLPHILDWL